MKARALAALKFAGAALFAAALTGFYFAALLTLWGIAAAPFVRLSSSSFVIAAALACSSFLTAYSWRRWRRRRRRQR
jgi:membrane protein implicated in regulation of membrane protease activity